ncbi:hypothetical protein GCM10010402_23050 [Actinomadura luteofluorescens]
MCCAHWACRLIGAETYPWAQAEVAGITTATSGAIPTPAVMAAILRERFVRGVVFMRGVLA